MHRPIGVTILAIVAFIAGVFEVWRCLVFLGIVSFNFVGKDVTFPTAQWGSALWAILLAAIWIWVAEGFWNVRAYAWQFGIFISMFTIIFGFFALLGGSSMEAETVGWLLAIIVFFYLNYPGVRNVFIQHEISLLTPEQRAAMAQVQAANAAFAQASMQGAGGSTKPPATPPASPAS